MAVEMERQEGIRVMVRESGLWEVLVAWTCEVMEGRDLNVSSSQVGLERWIGLGPILMRRRSPRRDGFRRADQELYIGHAEFEMPMAADLLFWRSKERSRLETFRWR